MNYNKENFSYIFGSNLEASISDIDYMPIINDIPIGKTTSESMKVMGRSSYVISLFTLNTIFKTNEINNIGMSIFDSPRNKDLDADKYQRFLKKLSESSSGQVFLMGSIKDLDLYQECFISDCFFSPLCEVNKLLKLS